MKRNLPGLTILFFLAAVASLSAQRRIDCAACHPEIAAGWRASAHARAWSTPGFEKALRALPDPLHSGCDCHAPDYFLPAGLGSRPVQRSDSLGTGVDCLACHMDSCLTAYCSGTDLTVPHWVRSEPGFTEARFCTGCHSWGRGAEIACQDCHMTAGPGPSSVAKAGGASATHRSHRWEGSDSPDFIRGAESLAAARSADSLVLTLSNLLPAHAFPQGSHRKAELLLFGAAAGADSALWREPVRLEADSVARYPFGSDVAPAGARVELRYYPLPEVLPDSFYRLERLTVR
ncbi:cytochrome c family protein [bacterium]|nr:cytochrome c family protein [bacterium]